MEKIEEKIEEKTQQNKEDKKEANEIEAKNKPPMENNNVNTIKNTQTKPEQENPLPKKKITFKEAQQTIKEFKKIVEEIEGKIKSKYGDCLPDFSYEEHLTVALKTKLITSFFESEEIKNITNKMKEEQK